MVDKVCVRVDEHAVPLGMSVNLMIAPRDGFPAPRDTLPRPGLVGNGIRPALSRILLPRVWIQQCLVPGQPMAMVRRALGRRFCTLLQLQQPFS